jgi:hypothetical protein
MVDITSLKVRLARLRLGSELDDDPRLEDPARKDLDKKRGSKKKTKKASKDPYEGYNELDYLNDRTVEGKPIGKRKKTNKLTRSDQKRGKKKKRVKRDTNLVNEINEEDAKNPRHYEVGKLTRSDQKRGSLDAGYGDYVKNTGGKRKKKNKLTRSDKKRP